MANNRYGVRLVQSSNNRFCHNNLIDNTQQVYNYSWDHPEYPNSINSWDNGYPSGGNYWSDHTFEDQNGDGVCDAPYVIDDNNQDKYPLMNPWVAPEAVTFSSPFWMQWRFWTIVVAGIIALAGAVYFLRKRKPSTPITSTPPKEGIETSTE